MTAISQTKPTYNSNKIFNICIVTVSSFLFLCLVTTKYLFGAVGKAISDAFFGCFGLSAFGILASAIVLPSLLLAGKKIAIPRYILRFSLLYFAASLFIHLTTSGIYIQEASYAEYLARCFDFSTFPTFGGILSGVLVYPVANTSLALAYVLFIVIMLVTLYFAATCITEIANGASFRPVVKSDVKHQQPDTTERIINTKQDDVPSSMKEALSKLYGNYEEPKKEQSAEEIAPPIPTQSYSTAPTGVFNNEQKEVKPSAIDMIKPRPGPTYISTGITDADKVSNDLRSKPSQQSQQQKNLYDDHRIKPIGGEITDLSAREPAQTQQAVKQSEPIEPIQIKPIERKPTKDLFSTESVNKKETVPPVNIFSNQDVEDEQADEFEEQQQSSQAAPYVQPQPIIEKPSTPITPVKPITIDKTDAEPSAKPVVQPRIVIGEETVETSSGKIGKQGKINIIPPSSKPGKPVYKYSAYIAPPIELLKAPQRVTTINHETLEETGRMLEDVLLSYRIEAKVVNIVPGPTVTRYEMRLAPGISVKKVLAIADDIGRPLSAVDKVRIEPQILGKDLFGVEVPNPTSEPVLLRNVVDSNEFYSAKGNLTFALGVDIGGKCIVPDLADMPHLLVAGATGMGKSVLLNSLIISLMYKYSPEELRFLLVDPKQVEFFVFAKSPHMLIDQVITQPEQCISALAWLVEEMERRYTLFKEISVKDIATYNKSIDKETTQVLPRIALVIDELNDLMANYKQDLEIRIKSLAQKARAAGIHLVFATQRPSVDVLTGTIKANFPCRVALKTTSFADSKTILDQGGADRLVGKGDILFVTTNSPKPIRLQGSLVTMGEVENVLEFVSQKNKAVFDEDAAKKILAIKSDINVFEEEEDVDPYFKDALDFCIDTNSASISMLQRHFQIGYNRAGRLIEAFADKKYVSAYDGAKSRKVLITREEFDEIYNNGNE